jgi:maltooligosyltrehalose trehalohydrolase
MPAVTHFEVWAPAASKVQVVVDDRPHDMAFSAEWWSADVDARPDARYAYRLDGSDELLPDPASRRQPDGVHGSSQLYDQSAFAWTDAAWTGRALPGAIIYELHIGTFTPGGTFDSAIERLAHLADLGVTHVELLPVNAVNGVWNWGYDGVDWYAVHEPLGGPDGLKRFVDAAHRAGLAVLLDVVYNHFGASGNYAQHFGPYFKPGRNTWGDLINLEEPPVRRFIIDNALMWLRDFHIDGLRLDAVHALVDTSTPHLLAELEAEVDALQAEVGRPLTLIAESDLNDPVMITDRAAGGYGLDAQWDDDVHHALHSLLTGETQGYYTDFGSLAVLAKTFTSAFLHDGTYSTFRGRKHGHPVDRATTPGYRFVVCLQNHDQVGNRAYGDRLPELTSPARRRIGAVLLLTSPFTPMLWMGEEWAASTRWPFFTSHPEPELAAAIGPGRLKEFDGHGWDTEQMIDPQDPAAYREAILNWDEVHQGEHGEQLEFYRRLITLRREVPELADPRLDRIKVDFDENAKWIVLHRGTVRVAVNLADEPRTVALTGVELILATGPVEFQGAQTVLGPETAAIVRVA